MSDNGRRPIPARRLHLSKWFARWLAEIGVTPNQVSVFGLAVGVGSGIALALTPLAPSWAPKLWIAAAVLVGLRGLSNMFDGMVAVEQGKATPRGILYNELPDRLSDVALLVGAGYSIGGSPTAGWLTACLALFVTYIRCLGTCADTPADFGGPFAKQQRMFSVAVVAAVHVFLPASWRSFWGPTASWGLMAAWLWLMVPGLVLTAWLRLRRIAAALDARG
jgi:phosphatidylglycerophosphate synthase